MLQKVCLKTYLTLNAADIRSCFHFIKDNRVLIEKKAQTNTLAGHLLFPGGTVEEDERVDCSGQRN